MLRLEYFRADVVALVFMCVLVLVLVFLLFRPVSASARAAWEEACGLPNISVPNSFRSAQEYARVSRGAPEYVSRVVYF